MYFTPPDLPPNPHSLTMYSCHCIFLWIWLPNLDIIFGHGLGWQGDSRSCVRSHTDYREHRNASFGATSTECLWCFPEAVKTVSLACLLCSCIMLILASPPSPLPPFCSFVLFSFFFVFFVFFFEGGCRYHTLLD